MTSSEKGAPEGLLDELDDEILSGLRRLWSAADPMPAELVDLVLFAVDLDTLDVAVLRTGEPHPAPAARGDELGRVITFTGDDVTLMVAVGDNADGTHWLEGWLAPAREAEVRLRTAGGSLVTSADAAGRLFFDRVPSGTVQLILPGDHDGGLLAGTSITL